MAEEQEGEEPACRRACEAAQGQEVVAAGWRRCHEAEACLGSPGAAAGGWPCWHEAEAAEEPEEGGPAYRRACEVAGEQEGEVLACLPSCEASRGSQEVVEEGPRRASGEAASEQEEEGLACLPSCEAAQGQEPEVEELACCHACEVAGEREGEAPVCLPSCEGVQEQEGVGEGRQPSCEAVREPELEPAAGVPLEESQHRSSLILARYIRLTGASRAMGEAYAASAAVRARTTEAFMMILLSDLN